MKRAERMKKYLYHGRADAGRDPVTTAGLFCSCDCPHCYGIGFLSCSSSCALDMPPSSNSGRFDQQRLDKGCRSGHRAGQCTAG